MRWRRLRIGVLVAVVASCLWGRAALAQSEPDRESAQGMTEAERLEYAKKLYVEGLEEFEWGDPWIALRKWELAYGEFTPHLHVFNYNIAQAALLAGDCTKVRESLQRFVDLVPEHPLRGDARQTLTRIARFGCSAVLSRGGPGRVIGGDERLPLVDETLSVEVDHQHVTGVLTRRFDNRTEETIEGVFSFDGGPGAQVVGFAYWNGSDKIVGEVFDKGVAREIYGRTVNRRRDPGLLVKSGDGTFSFSVFPIAAAERKKVAVQFEQWLSRRGDRLELRLPMSSPNARVDVTLRDARRILGIDSPTHEIEVRSGSDGALHIQPAPAPSKKTAGPLVVRWSVREAAGRLAAYVHRDRGHDAYVALTLSPPKGSGAVARDLTIALDRSHSMAGETMLRTRAAAVELIRRTRTPDRINVVAFGDAAERAFERPRKATEDNRTAAIEFINAQRGAGGTNLAQGLRAATEGAGDGPRPSTVLLLTDGGADRARALSAAAKSPSSVRLYTVGIGPGVDRALLSHLATERRGRFVHVARSADIESQVSALFERMQTPAVVDLKLDSTGLDLRRVHPSPLPDLFGDDELLVVGRVSGSGSLSVEITGRGRAGPFVARTTVNVPEAIDRPWVGRLWAWQRVAVLLDQMQVREETSGLLDEIIELALAYDIVTPYTAFLAIPESELMADTESLLRDARRHKRRVLEAHSDAGAIRGPGQPGAGGMAGGVDVDADLSEEPELSARAAENELDEDVTRGRGRGSRAGCASCRTGGPAGVGGGWLLLLIFGRRSGRRG